MFLGSDYMLAAAPSTYTEPPDTAVQVGSDGYLELVCGDDYTYASGRPIRIDIPESAFAGKKDEVEIVTLIINAKRDDKRNYFKTGIFIPDDDGARCVFELTKTELLARRSLYVASLIVEATLFNGREIRLKSVSLRLIQSGEA